jgi:hypothetical protein
LPGLAKLARNAPTILAGLLIGSVANPCLLAHTKPAFEARNRASG